MCVVRHFCQILATKHPLPGPNGIDFLLVNILPPTVGTRGAKASLSQPWDGQTLSWKLELVTQALMGRPDAPMVPCLLGQREQWCWPGCACVSQAGVAFLLFTVPHPNPSPLSPGNTIPTTNTLDKHYLFLNLIQIDSHSMCP